jgi:hypothetical protein
MMFPAGNPNASTQLDVLIDRAAIGNGIGGLIASAVVDGTLPFG